MHKQAGTATLAARSPRQAMADGIDRVQVLGWLPWSWLFVVATMCVRASAGEPQLQSPSPNRGGIEFFESRIRPVLVEHCYQCHSPEIKVPKGELRVDSRDRLRQGGESGHAVVPGRIDESLIVSALKYEMFEMPPAGKLDDRIIADFETWIEMGCADPRDAPAPRAQGQPAMDVAAGQKFWAFQTPTVPAMPAINDPWAFNEVDRFLLAAQKQAGVSHVGDADAAQLLRRVYFDLIGLPPSADEVAAFVRDPSRAAYLQVIDRLLESKHFGERWGRHWLDIVRYAESTGKTRNFPYPYAWRYRDYVIGAFNQDLPYDQFLREQVAGDLLPANSASERQRQLVATGFLALGAIDLNERDRDVFRMDLVGDQIDVLGRAVMGLTIGCAPVTITSSIRFRLAIIMQWPAFFAVQKHSMAIGHSALEQRRRRYESLRASSRRR